MKVLHTISSMGVNAGGPTSCTYTLIKGLNEAGIIANVLTFNSEKNDRIISDENFIHTITLPSESRFGLSKEYKIALNLYKNANIIHANGLWQYTSHVSATFASKNNIPFVLSPHGMLYPAALNKSKWIKKILLKLFQFKDLEKATVLHATCKQEMEYIRSLGLKNPIAVIPNPLEILKDITSIKNNHSVKRVGFIGRFAPIKNIEILIKGWAQTGKNNPDWELVFIGDGAREYTLRLVKLAESFGIKNILFTGFLSGSIKEDMIRSLTFLVLPSKSENFGMVVPEALINEIPVIASKGTPWEELNTCNAGWWIETGIEPLVEALKKAMQLSDEERQVMGQNGRKLVEENYSIESVAAKMIRLYDWILKSGEKPEFVYLNKE